MERKVYRISKLDIYQRLVFISFSAIFCVLLANIYVVWASPKFFYLGLTLRADYVDRITFAILIALIPAVYLRIKIDKFSSFFCLITYFVFVIPGIIVSYLQVLSVNQNELALFLVFSFWLTSVISGFTYPTDPGVAIQVSPEKFWRIFFFLFLLCIVTITFVFWGNISLVGFNEVYDQRERAGEVGAGRFANYLVTWLGSAFNAYLIASGIFFKKKRWMIIAGISSQLFVFSIFASKLIIISSLFIIIFALIFRHFRAVSGLAISFIFLSALSFVSLVLMLTNNEPSGLLFVMVSQIYMRGLAIQGAMLGVYADYFSVNELTKGSHITGVNIFVDYPYEDSVGVTIGKYVVGGDGFNANAGFFSTDGIAAFGVFGLPLVGFFVGVLLLLLDRFVDRQNLPFVCSASIPFIFSTANTSIFTSLITGGGLILIYLAYGGAYDNSLGRQEWKR